MNDRDYKNDNRAFLQALMARGSLTFEQAQPILAEILDAGAGEDGATRPEHISEETFQKYLDTAADAISKFDYEIRSTVHQETKQRIYAIVNTQSDPQTQLATTYSPDELSFIKRVLDAMFDKFNTPRMEVIAVTGMQAIQLARPDRRQSRNDVATQTQTPVEKGLTHSEVENALARLVEEGWFEKSREGFYTLSPRALLELRPWLAESFNDPDLGPEEWQRIKFCEACKDILTIGKRCANVDCNMRLHDVCEEAFWRTRRAKKCPQCSQVWTGRRFVGERAVTMTDSYHKGRGRGRTGLANDIIRDQGGADEDEE